MKKEERHKTSIQFHKSPENILKKHWAQLEDQSLAWIFKNSNNSDANSILPLPQNKLIKEDNPKTLSNGQVPKEDKADLSQPTMMTIFIADHI